MAATGLFPSSAAGLTASAPPNDNFADAHTLLLRERSQTLAGTNVGATSEASWEEEWYGPGIPGVWYRFTPDVDARLYLDITATGFNPEISAFKVDPAFSPPASASELIAEGTWVGDGTSNPSSWDDLLLDAGETYYLLVVDFDYAEGQGTFALDTSYRPSYVFETWDALEVGDEVGSVRTWEIDAQADPTAGPWTLSTSRSFHGAQSIKLVPDGSIKRLIYRDRVGGGLDDVEYWLSYRFLVEDWAPIYNSGQSQRTLPGFLTSAGYGTSGFEFGQLEAENETSGGIFLYGLAANEPLAAGVWHELRVSLRRDSGDGRWYLTEILNGATISTNRDVGGSSSRPTGVRWASQNWDDGGVVHVDPLIWSPGADPGPIGSELRQCENGMDDDADGKIDLSDPGCSSARDDSEAPDPAVQCANGVDDDGDGKVDLADPGCTNAQDDSESPDPPPLCANGTDDDADGLIDLADPGCDNDQDDSEDSASLLEQFAPELRLTSDETYRADSADIATDLWFADPYRTTVVKHLNGDAYAAADPNSELDNLSLDYLSTRAFPFDYLSQPEWFPDDIGQAALDYTTWVAQHPEHRRKAYGRVVADPAGSGDKILQYWMYYYYNPKNVLGIGKHEGDWEWIQVRLDGDNNPRSIALSQHGVGEKCEWGGLEIELSSSGHPVVYVAQESHANYFTPGPHPAPGSDDITRDDGPEFREVPRVHNVTTPPGWIVWNGQWGDSFGAVNSPRSPGAQPAWIDPWTWEQGKPCGSPLAVAARTQTTQSPTTKVVVSRGTPVLPRIRSVRITRTRYGKAVRVSYCFPSMPADPWKRPARLHLTLENLRDNLPPLSVGWRVRTRCGIIMHPVGPIKPPYLLRYSVESRRGTWSKRAQIRLR